MRMFCFSYLCGEYNPQTEGTMANVEFFGRIAWIYKQNALLLVVERKIFYVWKYFIYQTLMVSTIGFQNYRGQM